MVNPMHEQLSRRENQIMDVIYQLGEATASEIMARLPDTLSNSAVRTFLSILEDKGHLTHRREGAKFIYRPIVAPDRAGQSALQSVVKTFFGGSAPQVVATLLSTNDLSQTELDELARLIQQAQKEEQPDDSTPDPEQ